MLLVSAENRGCVSRAVGGGPAADTSTSSAAIDVPAGELVRDNFQLEAGAKITRQVVLRAGEYVSWVCSVQDAYTVDFVVKLSSRRPQEVRCVDRPLRLVGVDKCRVVQERERGTVFQGYLDLVSEHAECVKQSDVSGPVATLHLEVDNGFSFFTAKEVMLQVSKQTVRDSGQADGVMHPKEDPETRDSEPEEPAAARPASSPVSVSSALVSSAQSRPSVLTQCSGDFRLGRLQALLRDAIRLCPADAMAAQEHLLAAQARLEEYAQQAADDDLGPLS